MTTARKTTTPPTDSENAPVTASEQVIGPPLRDGQTPEKVAFAHHLRIGGRDYMPGDSALVSPEYARQLRGSGYLARGRA
ncbi:hypothetical protein [Streptomyces sp. NPDC097619]|uniref:hypothetical protein n=1 Tax=Streptomyces sp. NPDC097619 TaxID=3157228 RepID=UPI003319C5FC